jgi:hypothetical protein
MSIVASFLVVVERFCEAEAVPESTASWRMFDDSKRMAQIRAGADIGVRRLERATQWLSDNWPESACWPEGIDRPERQSIAEAAE